MNILPLILLTVVIITFSNFRLAAAMNAEIKDGLVDLCHTVVTLYDTIYEGDYHIEYDGNTAHMMKGEHLLDSNYSIIDTIKARTGVDITIFYQDTRMITTIWTADGTRAVGTRANDTVAEDVLMGQCPHFYPSTMVEGVRYFSYYEPLYASDGSCIGMIFLGKPSSEVEKRILDSLRPIILYGILVMLVVCYMTIRFSDRLVSVIRRTEAFVMTIANGELHTEIDADILERKDELGQMGRCLVKMQRSLQELVEQDILTGLYNRRSGEKLLQQTCENYQKEGTPFCVAIGDIDHFKHVNDTYGHECGDMTLAAISERLKEHMQGKGFVARWGGEEMLLVYNNMQLNTAVSCTEELLEGIRSQSITYGDSAFGVTMTFGIVKGSDDKVEHIVRDADARLYEGKNSGRNKIVYEM